MVFSIQRYQDMIIVCCSLYGSLPLAVDFFFNAPCLRHLGKTDIKILRALSFRRLELQMGLFVCTALPETGICPIVNLIGCLIRRRNDACVCQVLGFLGCCAGKAQHEKQHQRSLYHALLFHDFFHLYALMTSRFHIDLKRC